MKVQVTDVTHVTGDCVCAGYVYLLFDWEKSVKMLLQACTQHRLQSDDYLEFFYKLSSRRIHSKDVRITCT